MKAIKWHVLKHDQTLRANCGDSYTDYLIRKCLVPETFILKKGQKVKVEILKGNNSITYVLRWKANGAKYFLKQSKGVYK